MNRLGAFIKGNELVGYINQNKLTPITSLYNVTVNEPKSPADIDSMVVDMYIGVSIILYKKEVLPWITITISITKTQA